jgi:hypothetical protein
MTDRDAARFEFRTFGADLSTLSHALAARGEGTAQPVSCEPYIVTRRNTEANVKIRRGRLDVKGLLGRLGALEQWQPVLSQELPVAAEVLENVVVPALGLDVDLPGDPPFTEQALLHWAEAQRDLAAIVVEKRRTFYDVGGCKAEFTDLVIGSDRMQTVALEGAEAAAVDAAIKGVGLGSAQNLSYPAFLQRRLF